MILVFSRRAMSCFGRFAVAMSEPWWRLTASGGVADRDRVVAQQVTAEKPLSQRMAQACGQGHRH